MIIDKEGHIVIKVKSDKELLELLIKYTKLWVIPESLITETRCGGLCSVLMRLRGCSKINQAEHQRLDELMRGVPHPRWHHNDSYYWKPFIAEPRVEWLEEIIKTL